ncbi:MAG TPA: hypothetical protein VHX86_19945 [Tepidisphaeraceae bacterium]|jgi:hypothetical protein|nr:hypothetical protein [Tepidisphaeraceae bacterium]
MRWVGLILLAVALAGCASQPASVSPLQQEHAYAPAAPAVALAFDPPVLAGTPQLDLSRDDRGTAAFLGFQDATTTYYFLRSDDWYSDFSSGGGGRRGSNPDYYQRQAVSQTYGITYR